jgi:hypothetical protein
MLTNASVDASAYGSFKLAGRTEKSIRRLESSLRDQAQDIVKRLTAARDFLARVRGTTAATLSIDAVVLR